MELNKNLGEKDVKQKSYEKKSYAQKKHMKWNSPIIWANYIAIFTILPTALVPKFRFERNDSNMFFFDNPLPKITPWLWKPTMNEYEDAFPIENGDFPTGSICKKYSFNQIQTKISNSSNIPLMTCRKRHSKFKGWHLRVKRCRLHEN